MTSLAGVLVKNRTPFRSASISVTVKAVPFLTTLTSTKYFGIQGNCRILSAASQQSSASVLEQLLHDVEVLLPEAFASRTVR